MSVAEKLTTIAENQQRVYEAGKQAEYDRFWDAFQQNGNRSDYDYVFYGDWKDAFIPKYDIKPTTANSTFHRSTILDLETALAGNGVALDTSNCTKCFRMFSSSCTQIVPALDLRKATDIGEIFSYSDIQTIRKIILNDLGNQNTSTLFHGIKDLREVRFEGVIGYPINTPSCANLSNDSVQSIIDHLKDLTGATAQTITFHADVKAKMTQAQKDAISAKNWILA